MGLGRWNLPALVLVPWIMGGDVLAQEAGSAQNGLQLARRICAECHAVEPDAARSVTFGAPSFVAVAAVPGMTSAALTAALQTSHRTMPNIILGPDDTGDIVAYILSLRPSVPGPPRP